MTTPITLTLLNKNLLLSFFTLFFWLHIACVFAQMNRMQEEIYTVNEGLANRYITSLLQDQRGFIWIGTEGGLNMFNGYEFILFNIQQPAKYRLSATFVNHIQLTSDSLLLVTYRDNLTNLDFIDPISYHIESVKLTPEFGIKGAPLSIRTNSAKDVFVLSTFDQQTLILHRWEHTKKQFIVVKEIPVPTTLQRLPVNFFVAHNQHIWIKTDEPRLWEINGRNEWKDRTPDGIESNDNQEDKLAETIIFEDQQHRLWVSLANQAGLFMKMPNATSFSYAPSLPRNMMYNRMWEDALGNLLVVASERHWLYARTEAVFLLDKKNQKQNFEFLLYQDSYLLAVTSEDFNDVMYLGMDPGFKVVKNNYSTISTFFDIDLREASYTPVMRGMVENNEGIIYAALESRHWAQINIHTGEVDTLLFKENAQEEQMYIHCSKNLVLQGDYLWGSSCDGETNGYLIRYDTKLKTTRKYYLDYRIDYLLIDSQDRFWVVADRGENDGILLNFNPATGNFTPYGFQENINPLANARPLYLYETRDKNIWIGTTNGLYYFNPDNSDFGVYNSDNSSVLKLSSDYIMDIYEDEQGRLLLGTSNGLCILDRTTNEVKCLQQKDGLPNNVVCSILPDYKGNYWLSTFNGLSYFNTKTKMFRNFYASDGLSNNEFNKLSKLRDSQGRFYFGGINGINSFLSEEMLQINQPPSPLITKITRFDVAKDTIIEQRSNLQLLTDLTISPSIGYFKIDFALPQLVNPTKNQFQIKLEGLDTDWSYLGHQNSIRYNFLPPGDYTLKIKGADSKGNWSEISRDLNITVQQVFYKKWWFILLCSLAATSLVFGIERYRSRQKLQVERLRTKISSDLHDEVSGLLSGIAMQTDILQLTAADEKSKARLQKMGVVSRSAMSRMSDVIWSIDSRKDQLEDLLHRMHGHAEELLTPLQIPYNFQLENLNKQKKLPVELRQNLYFIFKECINNIAKHSNAERVNIILQNTENQFIMSVHDDGTNSLDVKEKPKPGQGLSNLQMRAERIQAELEIDNTNGFLVELRRKRV